MEPSLKVVFGEKLRILRTGFGLKQRDMAAKLNIGQQSYSDLEMGYTDFTEKKINAICTIFNISFKEFLAIELGTLSSIKTPKKIPESTTIKLLQLHHKKELLEKDLRIIQLERELKKHKQHHKAAGQIAPIFVMI